MKRLFLSTLLAFLACSALATPPCPPPPCWTPKTQFDPVICDARADWIAVGRVTKLIHHPASFPLNKDFTEFTFIVERWIKGGEKLPRQIAFHTEWCRNREEMRDDAGPFRFWGKNKPEVPNASWEFLHLEKNEEVKN